MTLERCAQWQAFGIEIPQINEGVLKRMPTFRRAFTQFSLRWFKTRALWRKMNAPIERHDFLATPNNTFG